MSRLLLFFSAWLWTLAAPSAAGAHGVIATTETRPAVALRFNYSDGEPLAYAQARVFAPGQTTLEHVNARTDIAGRLAFVPDRPGEWRVRVDDGMGHAMERSVSVTEVAARLHVQDDSAPPLAERAALGASLLLNVTLGVALARRPHS